MPVIMMWDGKEIPVKELEITIDKSLHDDVPSLLTFPQVEETLTLDTEYYKAMKLAMMLDRYSPNKAKRIRSMAEHTNPLRMLGLL